MLLPLFAESDEQSWAGLGGGCGAQLCVQTHTGDLHAHGKEVGKMGILIVLSCACLVESLVGPDLFCFVYLNAGLKKRVKGVILESLPQICVCLVRWSDLVSVGDEGFGVCE